MITPVIAPFGTWESPVTTDLVAGQTIGLSALSADGDALFWLESRPAERGRTVLVRRGADGAVADLTPAPLDVASRVHEYGGGAYVASGGRVVFSNKTDGAVWLVEGDAAPRAVAVVPGCRFTDFRLLGRWALCVREDARDRRPGDPEAAVVALDLSGDTAPGDNEGRVLGRGADFYAAPRPAPDGARLAWIEWDHPDMPWDATRLRVVALDADAGAAGETLALLGAAHGAAGDGAAGTGVSSAGAAGDGGAATGATGTGVPGAVPAGGSSGVGAAPPDAAPQSIVAPGWLPDGTLLACTDRDGWWNLARLEGAVLRPLHPMRAEVGGPHWTFGQRPWTALPDGRLLAQAVTDGHADVLLLGPGGEVVPLGLDAAGCPVPLPDWPAPGGASAVPASTGAVPDDRPSILSSAAPGNRPGVASAGRADAPPDVVPAALPAGLPPLAWIAAPADAPPAIVLARPGEPALVLRRSAPAVLAPEDVSRAEAIRFPSEGGATAHAWFYPPASGRFRGPPGERPPLVLLSHGGPTSMTGSGFSPRIQWWTSRGFAVADVNYGGSTGFGREYRRRLDGQWGVVDVADCVACARFLADAGRVDGARMAIRGGSAGGFTTLAALVGSDTFHAGASHYGVADLRLLAGDTHKFESRYLDRLVGPLPEAESVYRERSPLTHAARLSCPVIFFQGLDDKVVPPNQARAMVDALRARGIPLAHYEFEGEAHGFRRADTMRRVLELELDFYGQVFGFTPAGRPERALLV